MEKQISMEMLPNTEQRKQERLKRYRDYLEAIQSIPKQETGKKCERGKRQ